VPLHYIIDCEFNRQRVQTFKLVPRQFPVYFGHETAQIVVSGWFEIVTVERFRFPSDAWRQPQSASQIRAYVDANLLCAQVTQPPTLSGRGNEWRLTDYWAKCG